MPTDGAFKDFILGRAAATSTSSGDYIPLIQGGATKKLDPALITGTGGGGGSSTFAGDSDVAITSAADWDLIRYNGTTGLYVNDAAANNPAIAANTAAVSTLQSQFAALSTSSVVGKRGTNSTITNSTSVNSDLYSADATVAFVGDDALVYFGKWEVINTSGSNIGVQLLCKLAGTNSLNPDPFFLGSSGASTSYFLDIALVLTAGATNVTHSQFMVFQVRPSSTKNNNAVWSSGYYTDPSASNTFSGKTLDCHNIIQSTAFDIGTTRPSVEMRVNLTTAVASTSVQRIVGELYLVKDH